MTAATNIAMILNDSAADARLGWCSRMMRRDRMLLRRGTSMAEVTLATLLVAVLLLGSLEVVGSAIRGVQVAGHQIDAGLLTDDLMAEILALPYSDPDANTEVRFGIESTEPASPSNRAAFDDIDDYNGWTDHNRITSRDGLQQAALPGWQRSVTVENLDWASPTTTNSDSDDQGVKRITIEVTDPDGNRYYAYAIRSATGAVEQPLGVDLEVITDVKVTAEVDGKKFTAGANLRNHAKGP